MYKKYFVWNIDDGLEQDKKIIEILKEYGMGATFNLNSGLYGDKTYIARIGNFGFMEKPADKYLSKSRHFLSYVPHFHIPEDEVCQVYNGFEAASHGLTHKNFNKCSVSETRKEIAEDVQNLRDKFQQDVIGFAYPFGAIGKASKDILQEIGIQYARTIKLDSSFRFPKDPLNLAVNGWHLLANVFDTLERFFSAEAVEEDMLFLMFAHGYELDFQTKESSWDKFRRICETVALHDDIVCCSTGEAFMWHNAKCAD